ncbi:MAG TPA: endolytic transglycosylase MltG [Ignavibacteriaceae bacterium]|nr:endolytic transglycosylase MltG [Ignavibacteriaceae bacterium]
MSKLKNLVNIFSKKEKLLIVLVFLAVLGTLSYIIFSPNHYDRPEPIRFEIYKGETLNQITENLYKAGIIPNRFNFKAVVYVMGGERKLRAARYTIPNDLSYFALFNLFAYGKANLLKEVLIYNGSTVFTIDNKLAREVEVDSNEFLSLIKDKNFLQELNIKAESIEGYLLPGPHFIYEFSDAREVLTNMHKALNDFLDDTLMAEIKKSKYNLHQILTLASIVEGETEKVEEMPTIAGVYLNRLRLGMRLQADPTIQYIHQNKWRRLFKTDLQVNSPYNTYMYAGLPPGPIGNPGKAAILAAIHPEKNNYLFFVADGTGGHKFARNYNEHLKYVREYRQWLKSQSTTTK